MIYLQLFLSYLKIGFFGFGGGYAMLSLIQNEVVARHGWITASQFADIVALSQMTPGPIAINSATYVGYTVAGFWGSAVATVSVCIPSLTLMLLITRFFIKLKDNKYVQGALAGLAPVVIGMIAAAALMLLFPESEQGRSFIDAWSWIIFAACLVASILKVNPILLIILSAAAGIFIYAP